MAGPKTRVVIVLGTRPEAIKLIPVIHELRTRSELSPFVVASWQHTDLVKPLLDHAGIEVDAELELQRDGLALSGLLAAMVNGVSSVLTQLAESDPATGAPFTSCVMVHGDTLTSLAAALAAATSQVPVVHCEAGLRTRDLRSPYPEEFARQVIGRVAVLHLAPTWEAQGNLVAEAISAKQVLVTGNTGIDAVHWAANQGVVPQDPVVREVASAGGFVLVTCHRRESWDGGLARIATGVREAAERHSEVPFLVPMHPNPIVRDAIVPVLEPVANVHLVEPVDYLEFAYVIARSRLIVTDSGGLQEEGPAFNKPVLVARDVTERDEGVRAGCLQLVGTDSDLIASSIDALLSDEGEYRAMARAHNPYGDGRAAARIADCFVSLLHAGPQPSAFGSPYDPHEVLEKAGYGQYDRADSFLRDKDWEPPVGEWTDDPVHVQTLVADAYARFLTHSADAHEPVEDFADFLRKAKRPLRSRIAVRDAVQRIKWTSHE